MGKFSELLIEIGVEELPPLWVEPLGEDFARKVWVQLTEQRLIHSKEPPQVFCTPRRLAVLLPEVCNKQTTRRLIRKGPPTAQAYDAQGKPTKAAEKFAGICGVRVNDLQCDQHTQRVFCEVTEKGQTLSSVLRQDLPQILTELNLPKRMRWDVRRNKKTEEFVFIRPVRWLCVVYGDQVLKQVSAFGIKAGNQTAKHRNLKQPTAEIGHAREYQRILERKAKVLGHFQKRRQMILQALEAKTQEKCGKQYRPDYTTQSLDEAAGYTEYPQVVAVTYSHSGKKNMPARHPSAKLPAEVIRVVLQDTLKAFPVVRKGDKKHDNQFVHETFMVVANLPGKIRADKVGEGYRRVAAARLDDADFFYRQDIDYLKKMLGKRQGELKAQQQEIVFEKELGFMADKGQRVVRLAEYFCPHKKTAIKELGIWCKYDLITQLSKEYPSLVGTIGKYLLSRTAVLSPEQCAAIEEQYLPRHSGDRLPQSEMGNALALAERLDTIIGLFGIGKTPTGTKDPYALRRAGLGMVRILIENKIDCNLLPAIQRGLELYKKQHRLDAGENCQWEVCNFIHERLRYYVKESDAKNPDALVCIEAAIPSVSKENARGFFSGQQQEDKGAAKSQLNPFDSHQRLEALARFVQENLSASTSLIRANKRIVNLLKTKGLTAVKFGDYPQETVFQQREEKNLWEKVQAIEKDVEQCLERKAYRQLLKSLMRLDQPINHFFDEVLVMTEDQAVRNNRIKLLAHTGFLFWRMADFARIALKEAP